MHFIIFGPPGSGKGTYSTRLASLLGIASISTGDIFRDAVKEGKPLGRKIQGYLEKGQLVPDEIVVEVLNERLSQTDSQEGFILDGFPRTIEQAKALDRITKIDAIINLVVPEWIIIERLSNRRICKDCGAIYNLRNMKPKVAGRCDVCGGLLIQRPDDTVEIIKTRLKVYEEQTKPLIEFYEKRVPFINVQCNDIDTDPDEMVKKIFGELKRRNFIKKETKKG
jgi:adenylate kinase